MDVKTVCGYPIDELVLFATACRKQGITKEELHAFVKNAEFAWEFVYDEVLDLHWKVLESVFGKKND